MCGEYAGSERDREFRPQSGSTGGCKPVGTVTAKEPTQNDWEELRLEQAQLQTPELKMECTNQGFRECSNVRSTFGTQGPREKHNVKDRKLDQTDRLAFKVPSGVMIDRNFHEAQHSAQPVHKCFCLHLHYSFL